MSLQYADDEGAPQVYERCWFAAEAAVRAAALECETLNHVMAMAHAAWRQSRARLAELEALRDAFGDSLSRDEIPLPAPKGVASWVRSAA